MIAGFLSSCCVVREHKLSGKKKPLKELLKHNIQIRWHSCELLGARVAEPVSLFHRSCQADGEQKQRADRPPLQLLAEGYISLRMWKYKNYCTETCCSTVRSVPSRRRRWRHLVILLLKWQILLKKWFKELTWKNNWSYNHWKVSQALDILKKCFKWVIPPPNHLT